MNTVLNSPLGKALGTAALCSFLALAAGCGDSQIKTYRVAKEDDAPKLPEMHSADDGHDHGPAASAHPRVALPALSWTLPAGWKELPAEGMRKAVFQITGPDGKLAQVMIIPLPGVSNIELESVNLWREELGLKPVNQEQMTEQAQPVSLGNTGGHLFEMVSGEPRAGQKSKTRTLGAIAERENVLWFAKMSGEDELVAEQKGTFTNFLKSISFEKPEPSELAAAEAPASTNSRKVPADSNAPKWEVPAHWQEKAPGPMVTTAFNVSGAEGQAEVTIIKLPGEAGGLVGNVNRWRGQLGLPPQSDAEIRASAEMVEIDGKKDSYLADLKGTNVRTGKPARMLAMGVPRGGETWFYKMMGDEALVGKEKDTFLKFVVSAY